MITLTTLARVAGQGGQPGQGGRLSARGADRRGYSHHRLATRTQPAPDMDSMSSCIRLSFVAGGEAVDGGEVNADVPDIMSETSRRDHQPIAWPVTSGFCST